MHYANGRAARVGDIVRGKGYNFKHEIVGALIEAHPETTTCNCSVACIGVRKDAPLQMKGWVAFDADGKLKVWDRLPEVQVSVEYGQLDAFVALDPDTGEVLPPA
jgi:hypothetical protein